MVPFERALLSSYRPSVVTFYISLCLSEIVPLLCSSTPLFPTPPLSLPKFPHVTLRVGAWPLGYEERSCWANYPQLVSKISHLRDPNPPTLQTDRQTDGRHAISIPCFSLFSPSRGKNNEETNLLFSRSQKCAMPSNNPATMSLL